MTYDAIVIAGGRARRLGGADKPSLTVGGRTLLDRTLAACRDASRTVVVGPRRPTSRPVRWTWEERPGSGPLAAVDAGVRATDAPTLLVLSADLPFLRPVTVRRLLSAAWSEGVEGAIAYDGRDQPLLAAYRREPLLRELALLATEHGRLDHLPLRLLTDELRLRRVTVGTVDRTERAGAPQETAAGSAALDTADCDTWEALAAARARIREHGRMLDEWIAAAKTELGVDFDVDKRLLLDLARDTAHGVDRPAAPLTTFLIGYAAAQRGGSPQDVADAAQKISALVARWSAEAPAGSEPDAGSPPISPAPEPIEPPD